MTPAQGHTASYTLSRKGDRQTAVTASKKCLDYNPFGSLLPGRNYSSDSYRFGFGTQEKDDEIFGATGTSYTAEHWQYDPRVGRRWNLDPINPAWNSGYATFFNNPVLYVDHNGLNPKKRAQKYAKKHGLDPEMFTITEKDGRANLQWASLDNDGKFQFNSKDFGFTPGEWLSSWFPNVSGGRGGGGGDYAADRHWSRWGDWHVDLSWLKDFLGWNTTTYDLKRKKSMGEYQNVTLRKRQRVVTDNSSLSHQTNPGLPKTSFPKPEMEENDDSRPQLERPTAESIKVEVDWIMVYINSDSTSATPYFVPNTSHNRKARERNEKDALLGRREDFQGPFRQP